MLQSICEVFPAGFALIEVGSYPGMYYQLTDRVGIEQVHQNIELIGIAISEPCLQRYLHVI